MTKPDAPKPEPGDERHPAEAEEIARDAQGRRRIRLRPREGREHRYNFARRWEARRQTRKTSHIWLVIGADFGVVLLIYLLAREVIRRLGGD